MLKHNFLESSFTLIELILTTTILLVIVGLSIPILKNSYSSLIINLNAQDMVGLISLAREKTIMTRTPHAIKIDVEKNRYKMMTIDPEKNEIYPITGRWGKSFSVPAGLKITTSSELIKFFPDGTSSGADIVFLNAKGVKKQIQVNEKTGDISVAQEQKI